MNTEQCAQAAAELRTKPIPVIVSSFKFSGGLCKRIFSIQKCVSAVQTSKSSKVIDMDVGTDRKRVCDFLLVRHSNLGPIFPRFRNIIGLLFRNGARPYSTRILGVFAVWVSRKIILRVFLPTCVISVPERHRGTDNGVTQTWTAFCVASRGKNLRESNNSVVRRHRPARMNTYIPRSSLPLADRKFHINSAFSFRHFSLVVAIKYK